MEVRNDAHALRSSYDTATRRQISTPPWLLNSPTSGRARQADARQPVGLDRRRDQPSAVSRSCDVPLRRHHNRDGRHTVRDPNIRSPPFIEPRIAHGTDPLDEIEQRAAATMKGLRHMYELLALPCCAEAAGSSQIKDVIRALRSECERITNNHMKTFETLVSAKVAAAVDSPRGAPGAGGDGVELLEPEPEGDPLEKSETATPSWLRPTDSARASPKSTPSHAARNVGVVAATSRAPRVRPQSLDATLLTKAPGTQSVVRDGHSNKVHTDTEATSEVDSVELSSLSASDDVVPSPAVYVRRANVMTPRSRLRRAKMGGTTGSVES